MLGPATKMSKELAEQLQARQQEASNKAERERQARVDAEAAARLRKEQEARFQPFIQIAPFPDDPNRELEVRDRALGEEAVIRTLGLAGGAWATAQVLNIPMSMVPELMTLLGKLLDHGEERSKREAKEAAQILKTKEREIAQWKKANVKG